MSLLCRIVRIVRSNVTAVLDPVRRQVRPPASPAAGAADPGQGRTPRASRTPPARDPQLARYYANLEVPYGSDLPTVRSAWRRLMQAYHPDRHGQDAARSRDANELTAQLTQAYRELERAIAEGRVGRH